ncbi:MAG: DUF721 domain-containing protein [Deltaproteobacteria bacterium]|nr:DUF721 domain-containing protein [Deltaproteobacteria bacterium]
MAHDDLNNSDNGCDQPPPTSRLNRPDNHRPRTLARPRHRDRFRRVRRQVPIADLIGRLIEHHGLTDEVRARAVCLYWPEIVGEQIASNTFPIGLADGVLQVSVSSSSWMHQLHLRKAAIIAAVNRWVESNQRWLGPPAARHRHPRCSRHRPAAQFDRRPRART